MARAIRTPEAGKKSSEEQIIQPHPASRDQRQAAAAIIAIKSVHTLIFAGMSTCVLNILYSGLTGRVSRLTKLSLLAVISESIIFFGNGARCPLTKLAESLGSENGTVGDIFLPDWFAHRIPQISSTMVGIGLVGMGVHRLSAARKA